MVDARVSPHDEPPSDAAHGAAPDAPVAPPDTEAPAAVGRAERRSDAGPVRESRTRAERLIAGAGPLLAAFLLAVALRALSLDLPIEGDAVVNGALADSLAHGRGYSLDGVASGGHAPAHPALLAAALLTGGTVTQTSRVLGLLLGGLCASLLVSVGRRAIKGSVPTALLVVLAAAHPTLVLFAGGLFPGANATALVVLLLALRLALADTPRARTAAVVLTGVLPLVRLDLVAFPLAAAFLAWRTADGTGARARLRARAPVFVALFAPMLLWLVRTWIVTGSPFGTHAAHDALLFTRAPRNLLVVLGLIVPAAGLGLLWIPAFAGVRRLLDGRVGDRPFVRTALLGVLLHVALVVLFAGSATGGGPIPFVSSSLSRALTLTPFVILAAVAGIAAWPAKRRAPASLAVVAIALVPSIWLSSGSLQRVVPLPLQTAGRLKLLAEAFDAAAAEASARDWIALDLRARPETGVEVYLADRRPGRRVGVVAAAPVPVGEFPSATELPLREGLGGDVRCLLVSDREHEGVIFTGERPDLHRGGQGIFLRGPRTELPGGVYAIHPILHPPR